MGWLKTEFQIALIRVYLVASTFGKSRLFKSIFKDLNSAYISKSLREIGNSYSLLCEIAKFS